MNIGNSLKILPVLIVLIASLPVLAFGADRAVGSKATTSIELEKLERQLELLELEATTGILPSNCYYSCVCAEWDGKWCVREEEHLVCSGLDMTEMIQLLAIMSMTN